MPPLAGPDPTFGFATVLRGVPARLADRGSLLVALDAAGSARPARAGAARRRRRRLRSAGCTSCSPVAAVALAVVLADWVATRRRRWLTGRTGERLLYTLRVKTFAQLQRLGLDYYERELGGRIMTRMTTDVDALSTFLQTGLTTAVVSVLSFVGVLVAMLVLDVELGLVHRCACCRSWPSRR